MSSNLRPLLGASLLRPVIALNLWHFTMEGWMYALRLPAISQNNIKMTPESTIEEMNAQLPAHVRWPADNYNHLCEQPTQFYAVALTLAMLGVRDDATLAMAWFYVGARIVHSVVQATTNRILVRFGIFATSSVVLLGMTARAASLVF